MKVSNFLLILLGAVVLVLLSVFLFQQISIQNETKVRVAAMEQQANLKQIVRDNIHNYIKAEGSDYKYSMLGGIYGLYMSVTNESEYLIDEVQVKVTYIKANGDIWKEKIVDFNLLAPKHKYTERVPDEERGVKVEYEIVSIKSKTLGL